jgi:hypothetical protein
MARSALGSALALVLACSPPSGDSGEPSDTSTADVATTTGGVATTHDVPTEPVDAVTTTDDEVSIDCPWDALVTGPDDDMPTHGLFSQADVDTFVGCTDVKSNLHISSSEPLDLAPLANLRRITGTLSIWGGNCHASQNNGPASLAGLESLRRSAGSISRVSASPTSPRSPASPPSNATSASRCCPSSAPSRACTT